jgi:large exoprotein involved in heme utilization and adhesion
VGRGNGEPITVTAGTLSLLNNGTIVSGSLGKGNGGTISVKVAGELLIDGSMGSRLALPPAFRVALGGVFTGISSGSAGSGAAGVIDVNARALTMVSGGTIISGTFGKGKGGIVSIDVTDALAISGDNSEQLTGISTRTNPESSGSGGQLTVEAGSLSIASGGSIDASAAPRSRGKAGDVSVEAASLSISTNGEISAGTFGSGRGGSVKVDVQGQLTIDGAGENTKYLTGITSQADKGSSNRAGDVFVEAASLSIRANGEISAGTFGSGRGGSVTVDVQGQLTIDGAGGNANYLTGITSQAEKGSSNRAGDVFVDAGSLSILSDGEISTRTAGSGTGGDIEVAVASGVMLSGLGPQITAQSTSSGDAGSITVTASDLSMTDGAAISTGAVTSSANARDITLSVGNLLYLVNSEITTSVTDKTGNGGNIMINSGLAVLDDSKIIAQAEAGNGGSIFIDRFAGTVVEATDTIISASSQTGVSGEVVVNGITPLNGALVALSSELHNPAVLTRDSCLAHAQSSLVEAGRGGLPEDPAATLPALYIAGRDVQPAPPPGPHRADLGGDFLSTFRPSMRCN